MEQYPALCFMGNAIWDCFCYWKRYFFYPYFCAFIVLTDVCSSIVRKITGHFVGSISFTKKGFPFSNIINYS